TLAGVLHLASDTGARPQDFELQRLHGMGERLHQIVGEQEGTRTRIYAPVGRHSDLLAYLVRRLLENGANGSFVNMIADRDVPAEQVARDPFAQLDETKPAGRVAAPADLFGSERRNSRGMDIADPLAVEALEKARATFAGRRWRASP